jgi:hypothetical protein
MVISGSLRGDGADWNAPDDGSRDYCVQHEQQICTLTALPNVELQVLPAAAGAHPAMTGGFEIMEFDGPARACRGVRGVHDR